jgi:membrane protein DedA with SNARE-associated domain
MTSASERIIALAALGYAAIVVIATVAVALVPSAPLIVAIVTVASALFGDVAVYAIARRKLRQIQTNERERLAKRCYGGMVRPSNFPKLPNHVV